VVRRICLTGSSVHAVMFYGAAGGGKDQIAQILAQTWLCRNPDPETGADGTCQACGAYGRATNPDLLVITPSGPSSLIGVKHMVNDSPKDDDPEPLLRFFRSAPIMSRHKVAVIVDAHRMNEAASNSLLKTLEEPLPHAKLILTTDSVGGVRSTILSRCLAVACSLPTIEELEKAFPGATGDQIRLAQAAPGKLSEIVGNAAVYEPLAEFARRLIGRKEGEALLASEEFRALAEKIDGVKKSGARSANAEALSLLAVFLAREPSAPPIWTQLVIETHARVVGNANPAIAFDALFASLLSHR